MPLDYQNALPVYNRYSGKFSLGGVALSLLGGCAAGVILAFVYAFISLYSPIIYLNILVTCGFAFGLGFTVGQILKITKTRSTVVTIAIAAVVTCLAYYIAWITFVYAIILRDNSGLPADEQLNEPWFHLLLHPAETWDYIKLINESGYFTYRKRVPTGGELTVLWAGEAAILYAVSLVIAWWRITQYPFCEACQKWGVRRHLLNAATGYEAQIKEALERYDFSVLENLDRMTSREEYLEFVIEGCMKCDTTKMLTVNRVSFIRTYGSSRKVRKKIVNRLTLTAEQFAEVQARTQTVWNSRAAANNAAAAASPHDPLASLYGMTGDEQAAPPEDAPTAPPTPGDDLHHEVTISPLDAMHGTTVEVHLQSPDGVVNETLSIKIPAGVREGSKFRLRGKGHPGPNSIRGDLIIITHVTAS